MRRKFLLTATIIVLLIGISTSSSFGVEEKVSIIQRIKNAYSNFKNRQQQGAQAVKKEARPMPLPAPVKEQPKATPTPKAEVPKEKKAMTKEEMLAELKEELAESDEVFNMIPGLKAEKDREGKFFYLFNGVKIEDMTKEDLDKLLIKVHQLLVKIRTERIQKQMATARQAQAIRGVVTAPPQPPRVPSPPPSILKTPSTPPKPPPSTRR